jgi:hypothetical protein
LGKALFSPYSAGGAAAADDVVHTHYVQSGNYIIYVYDDFLHWDAYAYCVYDAENSTTGALSRYVGHSSTAEGVNILIGTPAFGITQYYSSANPGSWGNYFYTSDSLYWFNGITSTLQGSLPVTPALQNFQIAPVGNFSIGTSQSSNSIYNFGLNPLKLNYNLSLGSNASPYGIAFP